MERADFAAWCAAVCRHVRYRPARAQAAAELMDHLTDHAAALEDAGTAPEEAARTALAAMGDAGEVGRALDRAHPPLLCASVALTRACAVLLSVAACLFLYPAYLWTVKHLENRLLAGHLAMRHSAVGD